MNVLILGATGPSGIEIVKTALSRGHNVTALARDPSKLEIRNDHLMVIKGDILDSNLIPTLLKSQDAVIGALGTGKSLRSKNLNSNAVDNLLPVMKEKNVTRLVFITAFGVGETFKQASFIQKIAFRLFLGNIYRDKLIAGDKIIQSGLDWTLVYPVLLTNKPFTGSYKTGEKLQMKGMPKITRADLADFVVGQLSDNSYIRKFPIIMN